MKTQFRAVTLFLCFQVLGSAALAENVYKDRLDDLISTVQLKEVSGFDSSVTYYHSIEEVGRCNLKLVRVKTAGEESESHGSGGLARDEWHVSLSDFDASKVEIWDDTHVAITASDNKNVVDTTYTSMSTDYADYQSCMKGTDPNIEYEKNQDYCRSHSKDNNNQTFFTVPPTAAMDVAEDLIFLIDICSAATDGTVSSVGKTCQIDWINEDQAFPGNFSGACAGSAFNGSYAEFNTSYTVSGPAGTVFGQDRSETILRACGCN